MQEVRRKRPKRIKEISRFSEWGKILELNHLYHQAYLLDRYAMPSRFQALVKQCEVNMKRFERVNFQENGTKEAFSNLKEAVEQNLLRAIEG